VKFVTCSCVTKLNFQHHNFIFTWQSRNHSNMMICSLRNIYHFTILRRLPSSLTFITIINVENSWNRNRDTFFFLQDSLKNLIKSNTIKYLLNGPSFDRGMQHLAWVLYIQCYYSQFTNLGNQRVTYFKKKSSLKELG